MNLANLFKALFLPLTWAFLLIGSILLLYGGLKAFHLSQTDLAREGIQRQFALFGDCDELLEDTPGARAAGALPGGGQERTAVGGGGGPQRRGGRGENPEEGEGNSTSAFNQILADRCNTNQRPYAWLFGITGAMVVLTSCIALLIMLSSPSSLLNFSSLLTALTIPLVILSIYGMMQAQTTVSHFTRCDDLAGQDIARLRRLGFTCYTRPNRPTADNLFNHLMKCFWIGAGFSLAGLGMLAYILPLIWHFKRKAAVTGQYDSYGRWGGYREPESWWSRGATTTGTTAATTAGVAGTTYGAGRAYDTGRGPYERSYERGAERGIQERETGRPSLWERAKEAFTGRPYEEDRTRQAAQAGRPWGERMEERGREYPTTGYTSGAPYTSGTPYTTSSYGPSGTYGPSGYGTSSSYTSTYGPSSYGTSSSYGPGYRSETATTTTPSGGTLELPRSTGI